jgi:hypothetical protein
MSDSIERYEQTIETHDVPLTVQRLRELLAPLDGDFVVRAYEGEGVGIVVETHAFDPEKPEPLPKQIAWFDTHSG